MTSSEPAAADWTDAAATVTKRFWPRSTPTPHLQKKKKIGALGIPFSSFKSTHNQTEKIAWLNYTRIKVLREHTIRSSFLSVHTVGRT